MDASLLALARSIYYKIALLLLSKFFNYEIDELLNNLFSGVKKFG